MTPEQQTALDAFLADHGDTVRALLPEHLRALCLFKTEAISPVFTKYTIGPAMPAQGGRGDVWAMLHHFTGPDTGSPHCHPTEMFIINLAGRQVDWRYHPDSLVCPVEEHIWRPGDRHLIPSDCIHLIPHLPDGEAWTLCFAGPVVRAWQHYPELEGLRPMAPAAVRELGRPELAA